MTNESVAFASSHFHEIYKERDMIFDPKIDLTNLKKYTLSKRFWNDYFTNNRLLLLNQNFTLRFYWKPTQFSSYLWISLTREKIYFSVKKKNETVTTYPRRSMKLNVMEINHCLTNLMKTGQAFADRVSERKKIIATCYKFLVSTFDNACWMLALSSLIVEVQFLHVHA